MLMHDFNECYDEAIKLELVYHLENVKYQNFFSFYTIESNYFQARWCATIGYYRKAKIKYEFIYNLVWYRGLIIILLILKF